MKRGGVFELTEQDWGLFFALLPTGSDKSLVKHGGAKELVTGCWRVANIAPCTKSVAI